MNKSMQDTLLEEEIKKTQYAIRDAFLYSPRMVHSASDAFKQVKSDLDTWGYNRRNTKVGLVICRDDINFIQNEDKQKYAGSYAQKNFIDMVVDEYGAGMPLGGLGGFLTAGPEGIAANTHHAPQNEKGEFENYLLVFGTHIGYTPEAGFGYNLRNYQNEPVGNCGALVGLTSKIVNEEKVNENKMGMEAAFIYNFLMNHQDEIMSTHEPIIRTTQLAQDKIEEQVYNALCEADIHTKNLYIVNALIINTDRHLPDQVALHEYGPIRL